MDLIIHPLTGGLNGDINASPSKSYSHRAFIAAGLSSGSSIVKNPLIFGDVGITIEILRNLGIEIEVKNLNTYEVRGNPDLLKNPGKPLNCKNSGTSVRFFSALSLLCDKGLILTGDFFQKQRSIIPFLESLKNLGAQYNLLSNGIHIWRKDTRCNTIKLKGNISSQFVSAILFLIPCIKCTQNEVNIEVSPPIVSYPYIKVSLRVLNQFGITINDLTSSKHKGLKFSVSTNQKFVPITFSVPGDFSSAAFLLCATLISGNDSEITINNLDMSDPQGDKKIVEILRNMGARIKYKPKLNEISLKGSKVNALNGTDIDCIDIPDLFPILSILGIFTSGKTKLYNIEGLKSKESNRVKSMKHALTKMGVKLKEEENSFTIYNTKRLRASNIEHFEDHRIAMACTVASLFSKKPSRLSNAEVVYDSYPNFFNDLSTLGADIRQA